MGNTRTTFRRGPILLHSLSSNHVNVSGAWSSFSLTNSDLAALALTEGGWSRGFLRAFRKQLLGATTHEAANRSSLVHLPRFDKFGRHCGSDKLFRAALLEAIRSYWSGRRSMGVGSDKLNIPADGFMQNRTGILPHMDTGGFAS